MDLKKVRTEILNDKDALYALDRAVESKRMEDPKITREKIVDQVLLPIAYHESKLKPSAKQEKGGHGKGLFQFEGKSLHTAVNRAMYNLAKTIELKNVGDAKLPNYIVNAKKQRLTDARKLSTGQQAALLVFDLLQKPNANIANVTSGKQTINNFWLNNHWAGHGKSDEYIVNARKTQFSNDYSEYVAKYDVTLGAKNGK